MFNNLILIGHSSLLFIASLLFFTIFIRVVKYKSGKKVKTKAFLEDEINCYLGFSFVTITLGASLILAFIGRDLFSNISFILSFGALVYFFFYTCKVLYNWAKDL